MSNKPLVATVKVGPIVYRVKLVDDLRDGEHQFDGWIDYAAAKIEIVKGLNHEFERVVLLHEVMHAVLKQAGQASSDEKLVTALGYALVDLIQQNPELVRYLMQGAGN